MNDKTAQTDTPFPIMATIAGVEVVTIPFTEYAALLECRRMAAESQFRTTAFMKPRQSRIERDTEVAVFLAERFGQTTLKALLEECRQRFGAERTPPETSAHRYWIKLRVAAEREREQA